MKKIGIAIIILWSMHTVYGQKSFTSLKAFIDYASTKNIALQNNTIKVMQAKQGKLAAMLSVPDVNFNMNSSFTNNTKLPVSILPGEAFGGQPGSTREIQTGTKYTSAFGQSLDVKLVNLEGLQNLKLAKINTAIVESDGTVTQKNLQDNIAIIYFTILQLQAQKESTQKSIAIADTLYQITYNKYKAGINSQQSVNDSKINLLNLQENERQIDYLIQQNYLSLKNIADIPINENFVIVQNIDTEKLPSKQNLQPNLLLVQNYLLREQYALLHIKKTKMAQLPTLSLLVGNNYNQYNSNFTFGGGKWIHSQYIGIKLNYTLPNANTITNKVNAKYTYLLAQQATKQAKIKADNEVQQLENDWQKAYSQYNSNKEIVALQKDTYQKNKNLYVEGVIALDKAITSMNNVVNAEYNLITSKVSMLLASAKMEINNKLN
jgi:outer membrane protein TolC